MESKAEKKLARLGPKRRQHTSPQPRSVLLVIVKVEHDIPFFVLVTFSVAALGIVGDRGLVNGLSEFGDESQGEGGNEEQDFSSIFCLLTYSNRDVTCDAM